jgi:hypothetical protein
VCGSLGIDTLLFGKMLTPVAELIGARVGRLQIEDRMAH